MTFFVVRRHATDPKSETVAKSETLRGAVAEAMTFLMENGRDYEAFDVVEVDGRGRLVEWTDEVVSWEPRG